MGAHSPAGLRSVLREKTRSSHGRVDALFSQLDLAMRGDYIRFLESNLLALTALGEDQFGRSVDDHIERSMDLLRRDLSDLSKDRLSRLRPANPINAPMDPLGVHYVLAGANFGKRVLLKRWARSDDAAVLKAGRYLNSRSNSDLWIEFLKAIDGRKPDRQRDSIVIDCADQVFDLFAQCYHLTEREFA